MEKIILSIDLDIIMHPTIDLYNDEAIESEDPHVLWAFLENEYNYEKNNTLYFDPNVLLNLAKLIKNNQNKPIYFIQNHEEIVNNLKQQSDYLSTKYNIYNIDFHHDIWYDTEDALEKWKKDQYDCGNWLGYLYFKKKLSSITWLKAPNSKPLGTPIYGKNFKLNTMTLGDFDKLNKVNFDEVYFCLSPQWIPKHFHYLYDLFKIFIGE